MINNIRMKLFVDGLEHDCYVVTIFSEGDKWSYNFRSEDGTHLIEGWAARTKEETEPFTVLYNCLHNAKELAGWAELMELVK